MAPAGDSGVGVGAGNNVRSKFRKMYQRARRQTFHEAGAAPNVPKMWGTQEEVQDSEETRTYQSSDDDDSEESISEIGSNELHSAISQHNVLAHDWNMKAMRAIIKEELSGPIKQQISNSFATLAVDLRFWLESELADALQLHDRKEATARAEEGRARPLGHRLDPNDLPFVCESLKQQIGDKHKRLTRLKTELSNEEKNLELLEHMAITQEAWLPILGQLETDRQLAKSDNRLLAQELKRRDNLVRAALPVYVQASTVDGIAGVAGVGAE